MNVKHPLRCATSYTAIAIPLENLCADIPPRQTFGWQIDDARFEERGLWFIRNEDVRCREIWILTGSGTVGAVGNICQQSQIDPFASTSLNAEVVTTEPAIHFVLEILTEQPALSTTLVFVVQPYQYPF